MVYISQDCSNGDTQSLALVWSNSFQSPRKAHVQKVTSRGIAMSLNHCITGQEVAGSKHLIDSYSLCKWKLRGLF